MSCEMGLKLRYWHGAILVGLVVLLFSRDYYFAPPSPPFFVLGCVDGLWEREAENAILYLYTKALILA